MFKNALKQECVDVMEVAKEKKSALYAFIKKNDLYFQDKLRTTDNILKKKGNDGKPYLFAARIPNTKENPSKIPGPIYQNSKTIC